MIASAKVLFLEPIIYTTVPDVAVRAYVLESPFLPAISVPTNPFVRLQPSCEKSTSVGKELGSISTRSCSSFR